MTFQSIFVFTGARLEVGDNKESHSRQLLKLEQANNQKQLSLKLFSHSNPIAVHLYFDDVNLLRDLFKKTSKLLFSFIFLFNTTHCNAMHFLTPLLTCDIPHATSKFHQSLSFCIARVQRDTTFTLKLFTFWETFYSMVGDWQYSLLLIKNFFLGYISTWRRFRLDWSFVAVFSTFYWGVIIADQKRIYNWFSFFLQKRDRYHYFGFCQKPNIDISRFYVTSSSTS